MPAISKKAQLAYRNNRKVPKVTISEADLQKQCNDNLDAYGKRLKYIRIPDWIWSWLKQNAPVEVVTELSRTFGGMPDNVVFAPIGEDYNLCMALELKTKTGKLHGKQKQWKKDINTKLSRDPDETIAIIEHFVETVRVANKALEESE